MCHCVFFGVKLLYSSVCESQNNLTKIIKPIRLVLSYNKLASSLVRFSAQYKAITEDIKMVPSAAMSAARN